MSNINKRDKSIAFGLVLPLKIQEVLCYVLRSCVYVMRCCELKCTRFSSRYDRYITMWKRVNHVNFLYRIMLKKSGQALTNTVLYQYIKLIRSFSLEFSQTCRYVDAQMMTMMMKVFFSTFLTFLMSAFKWDLINFSDLVLVISHSLRLDSNPIYFHFDFMSWSEIILKS